MRKNGRKPWTKTIDIYSFHGSLWSLPPLNLPYNALQPQLLPKSVQGFSHLNVILVLDIPDDLPSVGDEVNDPGIENKDKGGHGVKPVRCLYILI
jgi:hypothetical protein